MSRIEVSKLANGEGHRRSSQLGFGLGTASRNWKCMLQQSFSSICGANNHGVNACNIASRSVLWLEASSCICWSSELRPLLPIGVCDLP